MSNYSDKLFTKINNISKYIDRIPDIKVKKLFLGVSLIIFSLSILFGLICGWSDVSHYYSNISNLVDEGLVPYRDYVFEYPPLALLFMLVPKIFSVSEETFGYSYLTFAFIFFLIGAHFIRKIVDSLDSSHNRSIILYLAMFIFANVFVVFRYDIFAAVIVIISLWYYRNEKYGLAFIIMAIGLMTKIYPAIFILALLIPFICRGQWYKAFKYILITIALCLVVEAPFLILDPDSAFAYLQYHSDRGLQVESVFAGFIMLFSKLFSGDVTVIENYGSSNISGVIPDFLANYMDLLAVLSVLLFIVICIYRIKKNGTSLDDFTVVSIICFASIMIFVLFSKVYSLQYIIWILSLFPLVMLNSIDKNIRAKMFLISILFGIFSMADGLSLYGDLINMRMVGIVNCCLKNIMHILLTVEAVRLMFRITSSKYGRHESMSDGCGA